MQFRAAPPDPAGGRSGRRPTPQRIDGSRAQGRRHRRRLSACHVHASRGNTDSQRKPPRKQQPTGTHNEYPPTGASRSASPRTSHRVRGCAAAKRIGRRRDLRTPRTRPRNERGSLGLPRNGAKRHEIGENGTTTAGRVRADPDQRDGSTREAGHRRRDAGPCGNQRVHRRRVRRRARGRGTVPTGRRLPQQGGGRARGRIPPGAGVPGGWSKRDRGRHIPGRPGRRALVRPRRQPGARPAAERRRQATGDRDRLQGMAGDQSETHRGSRGVYPPVRGQGPRATGN